MVAESSISIPISISISMGYLPGRAGGQKSETRSQKKFAALLLNESRALSGSSLSPLRAEQEAPIEIEIQIQIQIEYFSATQVSGLGV
jgi:hypothetical protein